MKKQLRLFLDVLFIIFLISCAEPVQDISLVQPHKIDKSIFEGEWYFRQTLVDVSPEISVGFNGLEGSLEKIRWEITENTLYAYRSYEPIPKLNENAAVVNQDQWGVVAAFDIISHFDVIRNYNTSTGEPGNLLVENSLDRPWFKREYMRVNWASNKMPGPADLTLVWWLSQAIDYVRDTENSDIGQLIVEPDYIQITTQGTITDNGYTCYFSYGVSHCGSAEARTLLSFRKIKAEEEIGFKPLKYMDNEIFAKIKEDQKSKFLGFHPEIENIDDPIVCPYDEYSPEFVEYCEPVKSVSFSLGKDRHNVSYACTPDFMDVFNTKVVNAIGYVDRFSCYEERIPMFSRFGFFRTERFPYDRQLGGATDQNRIFYANHHQIFSDDLQSIPKPIIYYTNPNFPKELEKMTSEIANAWDKPLIEAVMAKTQKTELEIRTALLEQAKTEGVYSWSFFEGSHNTAGAMFQIRRNRCSDQGISAYIKEVGAKTNVSAMAEIEAQIDEITEQAGVLPGNLLKVCAHLRWYSTQHQINPVFHFQQLGDLRYHFVNWVSEPQPSGPLGYGPSAADPENGRIISANANIYGAALDTYARSAADIIRALNEDLPLNDLISGKSFEEWLNHHSSVVDMMTEQTENALTATTVETFDVAAAYGPYQLGQGKIDLAMLKRNFEQRLKNMRSDDPMYMASQAPVDEGNQRLNMMLTEPNIASRYVDPQMLSLLAPLYGIDQNSLQTAQLDQEELSHALWADALNPDQRKQRLDARMRYFSEKNIHLAEFFDDSIIGLALAQKGKDLDDLYSMLREQIYKGVLLHEIGHTLGMTHNFSASFDALNYHDEYWQIRDQYSSDLWSQARLAEYQYASIMDYGSRFNSDFHGLGKYDFAAIRFVYGGQQIEVFDDAVDMVPDLSLAILINGYQTIPQQVGGIANISARKYMPLADFKVQQLKGLFQNSDKMAKDPDGSLAAAGLKEIEQAPEWNGYYWIDKQVPYKYCFDIYNGNLECKTFDEGASHVDVVKSAIRLDWNYYLFNHYRRNRDERSFINGFFGRQNRLGLFLTYPFRYYYFYQNYDLNLKEDLYQAAIIGLNFINQVLGSPTTGKHCYLEDQNLYVPSHTLTQGESCQNPIDIPLGTGRGFHLELNGEYTPKIDYIGSFFDKVNILYQLSDTSSYFFQVSNLADRRNFSIGFYRIYQKQLIALARDMVFQYLGENAGQSFEYVLRENGNIEPKILVNEAGFNQGNTENLPRIQASVSYNMIWQLLLLQTAFNTSSYDGREDFAEFIAISEVGSGDDRTFDQDTEVVEFISPYNQVIYKAAQSNQQNSISFELLTYANQISTQWETLKAEKEQNPSDLDLNQQFQAIDQKLGRIHDLITDFRLLRSVFDFYND